MLCKFSFQKFLKSSKIVKLGFIMWILAKVVVFLLVTITIKGATTRRGDARQSDKLQSTINDDGSYAIHAGNDPTNFYVDNAHTFLQADHVMHSTSDGSLKLTGTKDIAGSDPTGSYVGKLFQYSAGATLMRSEIAVYNDGEFVRFTQSFPGGLKGCNVSTSTGVLSGFPAFNIGKQKNLGFLAMFGDMCGAGYSLSDLANHNDLIRGDEKSGPLVLFDPHGGVMILSSFSNFMAHNMVYDSTNGIASYGIMGGATEVPMRYQIDTILYYNSRGINKAIEGWGQVLLTRYHKKRDYMESDFSVNYLGYYTDNGAYYYYHTEPGKDYATTILDVTSNAKTNNIPYGYVQYDSWWYYKGVGGGVKNWTSRSDVFPNGMNNLFQSHGLPVVAHNRYWSADTSYAKKNGGKYDFYVESQKAIPDDIHFWNDLMRSSKPWGLITYEQDWLDVEFMEMEITHTNVSVARDWLMEMGEGAANDDVTIQYCMALSRHLLQSVEIPAVTHARVSGDYHPGNGQWKVGVTSMFAHALYVAPFKDTFWTTTVQAGSPYGLATEPNTALQSAIATLSTGPVGPSDSIGLTNIDTLMKCCREDGLIIKPSRPITSTDETVMKLAFSDMAGAANADAEIYSTYSDLHLYTPSGGRMFRFGIILAADLTTKSYKVDLNSMYLDDINPSDTTYVAYQGFPGTDTKIHNLTSADMLSIPPCGLKDFQLWHVSPVFKTSAGTESIILGERSKWVPISSRRIRTVEIKDGNFLVDVIGKPGERVTMDFMINGKLLSVSCNIPADGTVRMSAESEKCIPL